MPALTPGQLRHFHAHGFLPLPNLLPPEVLHPLIADFEEAIDEKVRPTPLPTAATTPETRR